MPRTRLPLLLALLTAFALLAAACADDVDTQIGAGDTPATSDDGSVATTSSLATTTTAEPAPVPTSTLPPPSSTVVTPTVPTTTTEAVRWPVDLGQTSLPDVVIADGTVVTHVRSHDGVELRRNTVADTSHPVTHVHQASDGDVFVREVETIGEEATASFVRYDFDAGRQELDVEWIYDVAVVDGVESVIVGIPSVDGGLFGGVEARSIDDGSVVAQLGLAAEAEFGVTDFHWSEAAGFGVASAWADLTEWVGFVDAEGDAVELPSPTLDLAYAEPPYVTGATISPDGSTLYWAEGPDWGFDPDTNESGPIASAWVLRGADLRTGASTLTWPLSEPVLDSTVLDVHSIVAFDEFILVNRTTLRGTESVPLAPLVLDLSREEPELYEYPLIGIATAGEL